MGGARRKHSRPCPARRYRIAVADPGMVRCTQSVSPKARGRSPPHLKASGGRRRPLYSPPHLPRPAVGAVLRLYSPSHLPRPVVGAVLPLCCYCHASPLCSPCCHASGRGAGRGARRAERAAAARRLHGLVAADGARQGRHGRAGRPSPPLHTWRSVPQTNSALCWRAIPCVCSSRSPPLTGLTGGISASTHGPYGGMVAQVVKITNEVRERRLVRRHGHKVAGFVSAAAP